MENFSSQGGPQAAIGPDKRENLPHGDESFPCACYLDHYEGGRSFYPWHWHDEMEIAYVTAGQVAVFVSGGRLLLGQGDGVFLNRRVLHSFSQHGPGEALLPNLLFRPALLYGTQESVLWERYLKPLTLSPGFTHAALRRETPWQAQVLRQAERAFSLMREKPYGYEFRVRAALSEAALLLCENREEWRGAPGKNQAETDRVRVMLSYLQLHYAEPIQVGHIAASASVSPRECMRSFRRILGVSPIQYVIGLRLQKAKELLAETSLPLLEVCAACGFQNQSYFTKLFHQRVGVPPLQFRASGGKPARRP